MTLIFQKALKDKQEEAMKALKEEVQGKQNRFILVNQKNLLQELKLG
jgi:hypothetical protein